jgi:hypothetical protein
VVSCPEGYHDLKENGICEKVDCENKKTIVGPFDESCLYGCIFDFSDDFDLIITHDNSLVANLSYSQEHGLHSL